MTSSALVFHLIIHYSLSPSPQHNYIALVLYQQGASQPDYQSLHVYCICLGQLHTLSPFDLKLIYYVQNISKNEQESTCRQVKGH